MVVTIARIITMSQMFWYNFDQMIFFREAFVASLQVLV